MFNWIVADTYRYLELFNSDQNDEFMLVINKIFLQIIYI